MRIDIHAHIGQYGERQIRPAQVQAHAERCDLDAVLVSNLSAASHGPEARDLDEAEANLATLLAAQGYARLRPVYWVRPGRFDSNVHAFAGAMDSEPFTGALFAPALNGFDADAEVLDPYLQVLSRLKKVALFLTGRQDAARPARVYEVARRHPRLAFVLCSAAADTRWREALDVAERAAHREDARLYVETGRAAVREVAQAIKVVGAERILFGTDGPDGRPKQGRDWREWLDQLTETVGPSAAARITGANAAELFHIEPAPAAAE